MAPSPRIPAVDVRGLDFDAIVAIGDLAKVSTLL